MVRSTGNLSSERNYINMQPITIIQFAVRVGAYVRTNTDAPCMFIWAMFWVVIYVKYTVVIPRHELV